MEENKEKIAASAVRLIEKHANDLNKLTVREICKDAGVAVGLVNYYFESKEGLIDFCVERIIRSIVEKFRDIAESERENDPFKRLEKLSLLTLDYLFEHAAFSKISILSDLKSAGATDNTYLTYRAFLPLVRACREDLSDEELKRMTFRLIVTMQNMFLRADMIAREFHCDLGEHGARRAFHARILKDIIGEKGEK